MFDDLNANFSQDRLNAYMQSRQQPQGGGMGFQFGPQNAMATTGQPQKKKSFLIDQISTVGGIGGGILGGIAGGAAGLGIGAVPGAAVGGALGSGLGETLENILSGEDWHKNVAKETAIGGIFAGGPLKLVKAGLGVPGAMASRGAGNAVGAGVKSFAGETGEQALKTGFTGRLTTSGNKSLASQYGTITRAVAKETKPLQTIGQLADYGITKPVDAERISHAITGSNGILTQQVANAIGEAGKVSVDTIPKVLQKSIVSSGIGSSTRAKGLQQLVDDQVLMVKDAGNSPSAVMTAIRNLEDHAAQIMGKGGTNHNATSADTLVAKAIGGVTNELKDQLFNAAGANKNISKVLTPEVREQLLQLHPKSNEWARFVNQKIMKSKTIGDLRNAQSPFVKMSKIIEDADLNNMTFGGRLGNTANSLSGRVLDAGLGLVKDPASRFAGKNLRDIGTGEIGNQSAKGLGGMVTNAATLGMLANTLSPSPDAGASDMPVDDPMMQQPQGLEDMFGSGQPQMGGGFGTNMGMTNSLGMDSQMTAPQSANPYSKEALLYDIQRDPANAKEYIAYYQQLAEIFEPEMGQAKPLTEGQQMRADLIRALDLTEGSIGGGSINYGPIGSRIEGLKGAFNAGDEETLNFKATIGGLRGAIAKARAGTSMTPGETAMLDKYTPSDTDSEQMIRSKLQALRNLYGYSAPTQGVPMTMEDALMQQQLQPGGLY